MDQLYTPKYKKIMQANYTTTSMSANRIEEIANFAKGMNFKRIGIAHCITFSYETEILEAYLSKDFEVYTIDCKYGRLSKASVIGGTGGRIMCNPAGQAEYLNQLNTELNISLGLCVGHDMIFSLQSKGLVTNLFDKDFTNNNSPSKAISEIQRKL